MKRILLSGLVAVGILGILGTSVASAHGWSWNATPEEIVERQTAMFQHKADLIGVSVDKIKSGWAEGQSLLEIAEASGITEEQLQERMLSEKKASMQSHLQVLVQQGVITQTQADQRTQIMETRLEEGGRMGKGFHRGFGFRGFF